MGNIYVYSACFMSSKCRANWRKKKYIKNVPHIIIRRNTRSLSIILCESNSFVVFGSLIVSIKLDMVHPLTPRSVLFAIPNYHRCHRVSSNRFPGTNRKRVSFFCFFCVLFVRPDLVVEMKKRIIWNTKRLFNCSTTQIKSSPIIVIIRWANIIYS